MLPPSKRMSPSMRTLSIRSFSRLMQRSSVDLPQPEGPMKAVICFSGISIEISLSAFFSPYQSDSLLDRGGSGSRSAGRAADRDGRRASGWAADSGSRSVFMTGSGQRQTALPAYLRRRWLRRVIATRFIARDHQDQQQGGGEDQRLGGLHVRALEADVVDVEAEVHELALEVDEGRHCRPAAEPARA